MKIEDVQELEPGYVTARVDGKKAVIPTNPENPVYAKILMAGIKVAPPPEPTQAERDSKDTLTPAQFAYMLALNGWEETWAAAEAYLKANDVPAYARLVAQKSAQTYRLSATLAFVASMAPVLTAMGSTTDLSEANIRAAWAAAKTRVAI